MSFNLLAFAVPIFLTFIFIEYWVARRQGKEYFSFAHSVSNLNVGIAERLSDVFVTGAFFFVYDYLHKHYAIWQIEPNWYAWLFLLLLT
ncbi:MAG: sterol desaturase, partial [Bdellovibrionales bacterium]